MNFLSSTDISKDQINQIFEIADNLAAKKEGLALDDKTVVALFFDQPSTRTRVSFEAGVAQLGGTAIYIDARTTQVTRGEEAADTAKVLSSYCDFIVVRTTDHQKLLTMAANSKVPVINALTSLEHPTQALADCYTIQKAKGNLNQLKIAFIGDIATNTANSLMLTAVQLGAGISLVGPKDCKPNTIFFNKARQYGEVNVTDSIEEGLENADIVYTDTFVSMGDEAEAAQRKQMFAPYQLNQIALAHAKPDALVMHPLPAHRGEEIIADIIDGPRSIVWEQAKNKLVIEKAILLYLSEQSQ
jgi:ornithine carbamoyltransferase